ncbi:type II toxin-antitoxin system HipA family toxin [Rhodoferax sp. AJA081-3]|uniref:type II toxin-antitoxin system HipA family toxin n=1 Tax=Rhodoferax sp. AJA081-3 TaxID=2752316 RepID=UPI001ADFBC65|nr:type II toxin-antitoxin system HipA family toxin [Rhodoferax sp. AJA081-3]QTN28427.1 type II toxin-antitoxin system HipA family toxin [Rhodoferax sp. AJA081-3]
MASELWVWMNGQHVGVWSHSRNKVSVFQYAAAWVQSPGARALSLSLPMTAGNTEIRGPVVENYFDNLLPDSQPLRDRIRQRFRTPSTRAFELLEAIGRDCVGAVQLLPPGIEPTGWNTIHSEALTPTQVASQLRAASTSIPLGQRHADDTGFRISIAGAQEKTALLRFGGRWRSPLGSTPTTHILKLPLGLVGNMRADMHDSVENEWLCSKILQALGFKVANTDMQVFEDQKALVVERFDRRWQNTPAGAKDKRGFVPGPDSWIARLPQEDFCQIAGVASSQKYETDGGPGIREGLGYLAGSEDAGADRASFVLAQLAFWLLAATDGHAKNFSVFLERGTTYRMTPLYDVLSAWPIIGKGSNRLAQQDVKLAMALHAKSAHYKLNDMRVRHWKHLAQTSGVDGMWEHMLAMVHRVDKAFSAVEGQLPANFPASVWDSIRTGTQKHAAQFLREAQLPHP